MGFQIDDGKGRGFTTSVSEDNRLNVSSKMNPRIFYVSRDHGDAYVVVSIDSSAAAGDITFCLKNTSVSKAIRISTLAGSAANNAVIKFWTVTGTAASGTVLTPANLNLTSGLTAEAEAMGGEAAAITGLAFDKLFGVGRILGNTTAIAPFNDALIIGPGDQIAVEYDTGTTGSVELSLAFYFEAIARKN